MSALYAGESDRVQAVDKEFRDYEIHFTISQTKSTGYVTDGDISVNGHRYVIAEFKNETGNTSAEPYFQAIGYYLESTRESAVRFRRSPLPCLLLAIFGWSSRRLPTPWRANCFFLQGHISCSPVPHGICGRRYKSCQHLLHFTFIPPISTIDLLSHATWPLFAELRKG